mmetsp:Transcript_21133/g.38424  ORF Transcript_21133/g.38424 Transcript_21133/m.38424 type:complete len:486 (-) Transcript_21133:1064-2521(-)
MLAGAVLRRAELEPTPPSRKEEPSMLPASSLRRAGVKAIAEEGGDAEGLATPPPATSPSPLPLCQRWSGSAESKPNSCSYCIKPELSGRSSMLRNLALRRADGERDSLLADGALPSCPALIGQPANSIEPDGPGADDAAAKAAGPGLVAAAASGGAGSPVDSKLGIDRAISWPRRRLLPPTLTGGALPGRAPRPQGPSGDAAAASAPFDIGWSPLSARLGGVFELMRSKLSKARCRSAKCGGSASGLAAAALLSGAARIGRCRELLSLLMGNRRSTPSLSMPASAIVKLPSAMLEAAVVDAPALLLELSKGTDAPAPRTSAWLETLLFSRRVSSTSLAIRSRDVSMPEGRRRSLALGTQASTVAAAKHQRRQPFRRTSPVDVPRRPRWASAKAAARARELRGARARELTLLTSRAGLAGPRVPSSVPTPDEMLPERRRCRSKMSPEARSFMSLPADAAAAAAAVAAANAVASSPSTFITNASKLR